MNKRIWAVAPLVLLSSITNAAETKFSASNGVVVDVNADEFANRYEYSSPVIKFSEDGSRDESFALVAKIKKGSSIGVTSVQGVIYYSGDWHYYNQAIFKGGDPVKFTNNNRKVISCRYGCSFSEGFYLDITPAEIAKYAENGILSIQLRSQATKTAILNIPTIYFDAVNEASK